MYGKSTPHCRGPKLRPKLQAKNYRTLEFFCKFSHLVIFTRTEYADESGDVGETLVSGRGGGVVWGGQRAYPPAYKWRTGAVWTILMIVWRCACL